MLKQALHAVPTVTGGKFVGLLWKFVGSFAEVIWSGGISYFQSGMLLNIPSDVVIQFIYLFTCLLNSWKFI
jgi:hypothetical protein